jgi:hypothetical protein
MIKISSGLKTLFLVHFVVGLVVGLLYLFMPVTFMGWFGMPVLVDFPFRIIGAATLAFTASSWYGYKAADWASVKIVVLAEIVWTGLSMLVGVFGLFSASVPPSEWVNVIIMAGFAAAFGYFYSKH